MFKKTFDLNEFNERVYDFMREHYGVKPNVMWVNPSDYGVIRATVGAEYLRFAYTDSAPCITGNEPFISDMKIQDIKLVVNRDCKGPVLALVEGM